MSNKSKSGGGTKKYGRNRKKCEVYAMMGTRMKNKRRKVMRHYRQSDGRDRQAYNWLHAQGEL